MNREREQGDLAQAAEAFGGVRPVAAELESRVRAQMEIEARLASAAGPGELDRLARALPVALAALARVQETSGAGAEPPC